MLSPIINPMKWTLKPFLVVLLSVGVSVFVVTAMTESTVTRIISIAGNPIALGTFRTENLTVDNASHFLGSATLGSDVRGTYLWDLDQTVTNTYPIGEIFRMKLGSGSGFATGSTGDIFALAIRNQTLFDTTAGGNAAGGGYFEVTASRSAGSGQLTNSALECAASGGDVNYCLNATNGVIRAPDGFEGGDAFLDALTATGTAAICDGTHDATFGHNIIVNGGGAGADSIVAMSGGIVAGDPAGSNIGHLRANTQNGQDGVEIGYVGGGGPKFWSIYPSTGTLKFFEYAGATSGGGTDRFLLDSGGGATSESYLQIDGTSGPKWTSGAGAPASSCAVGDLYSNTSGSVVTTLYVCTAVNTWTAK